MNFRVFSLLLVAEWRAYPWRVLLSLVAIATGVALGFCVHLVNGSAVASFADALEAVSGHYDLELTARDGAEFDDSLFVKVAMLSEVAVAAPSLEGRYAITPSGHILHVVGIDAISARQINPIAADLLSNRETSDPFAANAIYVNAGLLKRDQMKVGDTLKLIVDGAQVPLAIAGTLKSSASELAMMDIAAAQWKLHKLHRLSAIGIKRADGVSLEQLQRALAAVVPAEVSIRSSGDSQSQTDRLSRAYRVNLDMLALMALFIGAFLVYSTQSLSVMRRGRQNALLHELGLSRASLLGQVLMEGAVLGVLGSLLGLAVGAALALTLLHFFGGDLGGGYFSQGSTALVFAPLAALGFFVLGAAASLVGSFFPARSAQRNATASALKTHDETIDPNRKPGLKVAAILALAAAVMSFLPGFRGIPVAAYLAMALLLFASIAAMPALVRALVVLSVKIAPDQATPIDLAQKRLWAAPTQGTVALCGIVASISLMVAMATMVSSFRSSVDDWLDQVLAADIYLHTTGPTASFGLDQALQQRLAKVDGVASVSFLSTATISLATDQPPITLLIRDYQNHDAGPLGLPVIARASSHDEALPQVFMSEAMRDLYQWQLGDIEALPLQRQDGGDTTLKVQVAGLWRDYARQTGSIVIDSSSYQAVTGQSERSDAAFTVAAGTSTEQLRTRIAAVLPASLSSHVELASPAEIRRASLIIFDRSFAITYLLEAVAIGIGLAGVAATFSAQTIARAREFGMLRHLGVQKSEILLMLLSEGTGLGATGVAVGLVVGLLQSQILIKRVNPQSFHWSMDTHVPWGMLVLMALAMLLASAGTSLLSGRGALSRAAIRAVREDW
jgi:putative ABC transport system permease protein